MKIHVGMSYFEHSSITLLHVPEGIVWNCGKHYIVKTSFVFDP